MTDAEGGEVHAPKSPGDVGASVGVHADDNLSPFWPPRFTPSARPSHGGSPRGSSSSRRGPSVISDMVKPLAGSVGSSGHSGGGDGFGHVHSSGGMEGETHTARGNKCTSPAAKVALVIWLLGCSQVVARAYSVSDERVASLAHLYYQAPAIVLMAVWLWGVNLLVWARMALTPHPLVVFDLHDPRVHLTHRQVFNMAAWCSAVFAGNLAVFLRAAVNGHDALAAWMPVVLYLGVPAALLVPVNTWHVRSRRFFARTLRRMVVPLQPISFADFFLADVACSMAKSFSDVERAVCSMLMGSVMRAADHGGTCGSTSWKIPLALAVPSIIRLLQCLRQYKDTKQAGCLWNALKYSSAFPVIILSALKYHVSHRDWMSLYRPAWLACSLVSTAYSYYWDVKHDWDLTLFRCGVG
eukprot:CAMPEP_0181367776 /NCGR_PEP_ID=MMETSP1106-20121128/11644_1 /TAXON_ID=81844 /ORGANISM="Mantoniella antarctica, Strain SL-175" /LENGTH=410 /DNA_ID=CAMNT_0023483667 /DNA_START=867 /DNA_END=2096 /DNA_ORIENTATION=-